MPRQDQRENRRAELMPAIAATFAKHGYRRTTTAMLAAASGAQETILYRLWPDKRRMFIAVIDYVVVHSEAIWQRTLGGRRTAKSSAETVLDYEADHLGEFGLYRILFAGLSETDDAEIKAALRAAYARFQAFLCQRVAEHRAAQDLAGLPHAELVAWALLGLGTVVNVGRELDLLDAKERARLLRTVGRHLLG
ncbi:MAG: TetR/AcrR family transcriptional regulator [Planctomycetes bacterium]|nr:TetR/AcrR family transcriptional regulator [Planctomycetota bacterium]MCC7396499.1 TetR/AcrR family transcriptional regulator [Planctomycetota bacterium]